ncbi:MAG: U32 family peptidase [Candidatus Lokiarchaeota archaeon]|nr:U32 family peptidase [Candidatus Lokiarchaeota archaeon]
MKKVELLAPAKNIKAIKAGLKYADSFYFGAKSFNMRMQADNFSENDLPKAVKLCHDNGLKAYITTNILIYEDELKSLFQILENAKSIGFDGAIIHDIAAIQYAKEVDIPFHISTQANISNSVAAKFYEELGASRLILARECSLKQITEIKNNLSKAEIEVFVHGAMCTSISGRCYFSLDVCQSQEYSANRGRCVQPCRRQWRVIDEENNEYIYDGERFLNSRDLCMIEFIPQLIEAKIDAFKIEGRMRSPHYVEIISKIYREAIEDYYNGNFSKKMVGKWIYELKKEYNRGFTHGFYFDKPTEKDQQHKSPTNLSHWRLIQIGSIKNYSKSSKNGTILLDNGYLKIGMDVLIQGGSTSNTYFHQKIRYIKINGKNVKSTEKATKNKKFELEINLDEPVNSNLIDNLYIFTEKTYISRKDKKPRKFKSDYYKF